MRLLSGWVQPTSSDHDAVLARYRHDQVDFVLACLNVGSASSKLVRKDLARLCATEDLLALVLTEVGDRDLAELLPEGWAYRVRSRVAICWPVSRKPEPGNLDRLLSSRVWGGEGAGPSWVKRKHLVGEQWRIGDGLVAVGGVHLVASQWNPLRKAIAWRQVRRIAAWATSQRANEVVVLGDFNAKPTSRVLRPLRWAGLDRVPTRRTHRAGAIDHQWHS